MRSRKCRSRSELFSLVKAYLARVVQGFIRGAAAWRDELAMRVDLIVRAVSAYLLLVLSNRKLLSRAAFGKFRFDSFAASDRNTFLTVEPH